MYIERKTKDDLSGHSSHQQPIQNGLIALVYCIFFLKATKPKLKEIDEK
nr:MULTISPECIES: hypothetical protein [Listeria]UCK61652.1 hypothetical protein pLIS47_00106c [Listeria ivanovii]UCK61777.1 hypothetical protein pLIS50_00106c [Listeria seeligeri]UCK61917.1 hypothetical protein pLIS52_00086c [Listeria seeligeri]